MYLGAPMIHQRISRNSFTFIIDEMQKKLSTWKASMKGNSRSFIFILYLRLCHANVKHSRFSVLRTRENLYRLYLGINKSTLQMSSYFLGEICRPKEEGDMGFRSLCMLNKSFKLVWQIIAKPNKFRV
jgi:hypothetical protein